MTKDRLTKAIEIAAHVHRGQTDKSGVPYIRHVLKVMEMAEQRAQQIRRPSLSDTHLESVLCAAVLHDSLEDFEGTPAERQLLRDQIREEMGALVSDALTVLTHDSDVSYEDYIEQVASNTVARLVKICDLMHNMDPRRLPLRAIEEKDLDRWHKYRKALVRLERA